MSFKFPLPKGAIQIKPIKKKIDGWVELEYDAKVVRLGMTWYRAKDGFGQRGDREDWVADIPSSGPHVARYAREPWKSGFVTYKTFDAAVKGQIKEGIKDSVRRLADLRCRVDKEKETLHILKMAIS